MINPEQNPAEEKMLLKELNVDADQLVLLVKITNVEQVKEVNQKEEKPEHLNWNKTKGYTVGLNVGDNMSWKQMLEVKPEVGTAVDVVTSGDPCCETARDKFIEALEDRVYSIDKVPKISYIDVKEYVENASCEELRHTMNYLVNHKQCPLRLKVETIQIMNEWIECDGSDEPLHAIPVE